MTTRLLCLALGSGCADVARLAQTLDARGVQSCLFYSGSYGPFLGIHGITATGGASLTECMRRGMP